MSATAEPVVCELISLLSLERLEDNLFRGQSRDIGTKYVFGGQVLGQALSAAQATVENGRQAHSLHAYFLRVGNIDHPIVYDVDRTRDGGSFSVRRVTAIQHGKVIFSVRPRFRSTKTVRSINRRCRWCPAGRHRTRRPADTGSVGQAAGQGAALAVARRPVRVSPCVSARRTQAPKRAPFQQMWLRLNNPIGDDVGLHRALLAYASDFQLLGTSTFPHGISYYTPNVQMASLDHALWFHRPFRTDDWLLYSLDSPTAQGARGLARGQFSPATACWWPAPRRKV